MSIFSAGYSIAEMIPMKVTEIKTDLKFIAVQQS